VKFFLANSEPSTHGALRGEIRAAIASGLPVYAECGGLMYLSRSIAWNDRRCAMVGAIAADAVMHDRPRGKGYVLLEETEHAPWPSLAPARKPIAAHEFHFAALENLSPDVRFAYRVLRGQGITGRHDGIVVESTLASFSHLRGVSAEPWPTRFAAFMRRCAAARAAPIAIATGPRRRAATRRAANFCAPRRRADQPLSVGEPR
jgi:cobyrinic acid a,c-diamide synthase